MLIPVVPPFRRRRGKARPAGLAIVSVLTQGAELVVTFSGPITWDGSTVPSAFQAFTTDEDFQSCINVNEVGAAYVKLEFNADVDAGAAWQLVGPMAGISPAVAWPQTGVVEP